MPAEGTERKRRKAPVDPSPAGGTSQLVGGMVLAAGEALPEGAPTSGCAIRDCGEETWLGDGAPKPIPPAQKPDDLGIIPSHHNDLRAAVGKESEAHATCDYLSLDGAGARRQTDAAGTELRPDAPLVRRGPKDGSRPSTPSIGGPVECHHTHTHFCEQLERARGRPLSWGVQSQSTAQPRRRKQNPSRQVPCT